MYGDRRPYVLHYFLEDDTVEILEVSTCEPCHRLVNIYEHSYRQPVTSLAEDH